MSESASSAITRFLTESRFRWVHHLLFWLVFFSDELLSLVGITDPLETPWPEHLAQSAVPFLCVYLNLLVLIPFLLQKGRVIPYVISFIATIGLHFALSELLIAYFPECSTCRDEESFNPITEFIISGLDFAFLLGITSGLKLLKIWLRDRERIQSLEKEKLSTELEFLKAQMNPHFLFNALNNIYVLTRTQPEQGSETLLQLSDLLRYQLYDCAADKVPLQKEIDYLKNFLELDRIRKAGAQVSFEVEGEARGRMVPPMLFLPLIENAVKHGNTGDEGSWIRANMHIRKDGLAFFLENSTGPARAATGPGGIGLTNLKRRLELLYPGRHKLILSPEEGKFRVEMELRD